MTLRVSIVSYAPDLKVLEATLTSLLAAVRFIPDNFELVIVDNGPEGAASDIRLLLSKLGISAILITGHGNVGYGRGHNRSLSAASEFHLILNPDVELAPDALIQAMEFMRAYPDCGLIAPAATDATGNPQYLCKRYPTVFDLAVRGFAPAWIKRIFARQLALYEMRDVIGDSIYWEPQIVSGCFMLFRSSVLQRLGGFDPSYFLYFEDFDLSLRAAALTRIAYVPQVRIVHHGGGAAGKGWRHIRMFIASASKFFGRHGWRYRP